MARSYRMQLFNSGSVVDKRAITTFDTIQAVTTNHIFLYIADGVALHRAVEIAGGWVWLYNGLRDRNLIEETINGSKGALYSAAPVDSLVEPSRNTSWNQTGFDQIVSGTIGIGLGQAAMNGSPQVVIENAFKQMIDFATEEDFGADPGVIIEPPPPPPPPPPPCECCGNCPCTCP